MHEPIYVKIHRYDADDRNEDAYSVTELKWDDELKYYERGRTNGLFRPEMCEKHIATLNVDKPVNIMSVLVSDEIRKTVASTVIPFEWKETFYTDEDTQKRVEVLFPASKVSWDNPSQDRDHGPASRLYDALYAMAQDDTDNVTDYVRDYAKLALEEYDLARRS